MTGFFSRHTICAEREKIKNERHALRISRFWVNPTILNLNFNNQPAISMRPSMLIL